MATEQDPTHLEEIAVALLEDLLKQAHARVRDMLGPDRTGEVGDQILREALEDQRFRAFEEGERVSSSKLVSALCHRFPEVRQGDIRAAVVRCLASGKMHADASWSLTLPSENEPPSVESMFRGHITRVKQENEDLTAKVNRLEGTISEIAYLVGAAGKGTLLERGMRWSTLNETQQREAVIEAVLVWRNRLRDAKANT